jgi:hypothetical protein
VKKSHENDVHSICKTTKCYQIGRKYHDKNAKQTLLDKKSRGFNAMTRERGCGNKCGGVRKGHSRRLILLMITKPNNRGPVEKGTVCFYNDKPISYIKLITYGKASASSMVKATLPRLCIQMAARYHSFLYIRIIILPCILAQLGTSWA